MIFKEKQDIIKMQQGGAIPPFASYINVPQPMGTAPQTAAALGELKQEMLSDKLKLLLYEKGLPSDVDYFYNMVNLMGNSIFSSPFSSSGMNLNANLVGSYLTKIGHNSSEFTRVVGIAKENGGLPEVAVTSTGRLVSLNEEGEIKMITPGDYAENKDKYRLLTNSDLALLRANNPGMAFNSDIFNVIENGIGTEKITSYLWDTISKLGKSTRQTDTFVNKTGRVAEGIKELLDEGPLGIYKVTTKLEGLGANALAALKYLYTTLPENARTLLKAKAVQAGAVNPEAGALLLIGTLITAGISDSTTTSLDYDEKSSTAAGAGSSGGQEDVSAVQLFIDGNTADKRVYRMNPGTSLEVDAPINLFNKLPTMDNKPAMDKDILSHALEATALTAGLRGSVSMGGKILSDHEKDLVLLDTTEGVGQVWLPYIDDGKGHIVPDLELTKKLQAADKQVEDEGNIAPIRAKQIYEENGVGLYYGHLEWTADTASKKGLLKPFWVANGITSSLVIDDKSGLVSEVDSDSVDGLIVEYNRVVKNLSKEKDPVMGRSPWESSLFYLNRDLYTGTVFIPISNDRLSTRALAGKITQPKGFSDIDVLHRAEQHNVRALNEIKTQFE